jgi:cyclohexyl-isocyanide hydratase
MDVGIVVFDGADSLDVIGPMRIFSAVNEIRAYVEAPEVRVHLVADSDRPIRLAHGPSMPPTVTFDACPPLDVLVVPGGSSTSETEGRRVAQRDQRVMAFVRERSAAAQVTASVCTGAFILAEAGLLDGRRANTHWRWRDELRELMTARGEPIDIVPQRVVWDGDVVTGGGVTSGIDLAFEVVEHLCGAPARKAVEAAVERETV